jgi:phosphoribosylformylglycinamidine (FGAM) synthase-like enzyme
MMQGAVPCSICVKCRWKKVARAPKEIWSNESQERYVMAIAPESLPLFSALCERERCPFAVVGTATEERQLRVIDPQHDNTPVDMPMDVYLANHPKCIAMYNASSVQRLR